ncbi:uncharacterized protein C1orf21 homolog isoform X1 [Phoca vitulina]|uniref:uncharacterized protein C1orf21 homolog isoform X1 n=1 Tax=Phoca vitulina TaxID=9720 RepID=UPI0013962049|nr:uncharacterized protein C1orf21 homolog isoform X1 [Phoca vitulina]
MGCASAKHVATVQNEEEAQKGKNYQNGDVFGDEYRIKPVEEVKYMKNGAEEEQKIAARNQENLNEASLLWTPSVVDKVAFERICLYQNSQQFTFTVLKVLGLLSECENGSDLKQKVRSLFLSCELVYILHLNVPSL